MGEHITTISIALVFIGSLVTMVSFMKGIRDELKRDTDEKTEKVRKEVEMIQKVVDIKMERIYGTMTTLVSKESCGLISGHINKELAAIKVQTETLQSTMMSINEDMRDQRKDMKTLLQKLIG